MTIAVPSSLRLQIGILGRCNVGKSSLFNLLTGEDSALVSAEAGTTADPVIRSLEWVPIGPVTLIDTAGLDDLATLGAARAGRSYAMIDRLDAALLVTTTTVWEREEEELALKLKQRNLPVLVVLTKADLEPVSSKVSAALRRLGLASVVVTTSNRAARPLLREAVAALFPQRSLASQLIRDLIKPKEIVILVIPLDQAAPAGRLLLTQVQTIRDALDSYTICLMVRESEYQDALSALKGPPTLVITDSSIFAKIEKETPKETLLTSFSILFARLKGDLWQQVHGAQAIKTLRPGDAVLVAEACAHHPLADDIGRVKLPRLLQQFVGGELAIKVIAGHDFNEDLTKYKLVVMCGSCMLGRREVLSRLARCKEAAVPVTNYGVAIAYCLGILKRTLAPFVEIADLVAVEEC